MQCKEINVSVGKNEKLKARLVHNWTQEIMQLIVQLKYKV